MAIAGTYYFVSNLLDNKEVENKEYVANFSKEDSGVVKLGQLANYDSISNRPLFTESRELAKKVIKEKRKVIKPVIQDLKVQALGIALTGEGVLAVIKDLRNGKIVRLRINEEIYGWSLQGVSEENFVFMKDKQRKLINFKK